ncbi:MAG: LapA family protein [Gemmatimonadetes bacterium]|nr:LapA family protein [Gemmatimonadota bacterium]
MNGIPGRIAIILGSSAIAALFAWLNMGERVTLRLGIVTLRSIPLSAVVFLSILIGMTLVFVVGLRSDLKTRRMVRRYREALGQEWPPGRADDTHEGP